MPGDQGDVDLGNDGVFVADDAGEQLLAGLQHAQEVVADFVLDRLRLPAAVAQDREASTGERKKSSGRRLQV